MCLSQDTVLINVINIRKTDDPEELKYFTKAQLKIRDDWRSKHIKKNKSSLEENKERLYDFFKTISRKEDE